MGIGTSSSSSGASAPRANAYAVNRDASELGRSRAPEGTSLSSAWPDACHLFGYLLSGKLGSGFRRRNQVLRLDVPGRGPGRLLRLASWRHRHSSSACPRPVRSHVPILDDEVALVSEALLPDFCWGGLVSAETLRLAVPKV